MATLFCKRTDREKSSRYEIHCTVVYYKKVTPFSLKIKIKVIQRGGGGKGPAIQEKRFVFLCCRGKEKFRRLLSSRGRGGGRL